MADDDYMDAVPSLDDDKGFFLVCEGGKIDWACHANDAASAIHGTLALADAVQAAIVRLMQVLCGLTGCVIDVAHDNRNLHQSLRNF